jgi:hypothetical protein
MSTSASTVEVRVTLVPLEAAAPVAGTVGGVDAVAVRAPARIVRRVTLRGAAVVDVPDGPVEHQGHGKVVGAIKIRALAVLEVEPGGVHEEHVVARRYVAGEGRVPLRCVEVVELVRLEEVDAGRYLTLAAPHPGALPRNGVLRQPAHGRAAADIVAETIDEVAKVGAAERDKAVLGRRKAVACAEEGYVRACVLFDKPTCGVVALARRFVVGPNLAGGEGQAGELVVVASCAEAGRGVMGVVADELEAL